MIMNIYICEISNHLTGDSHNFVFVKPTLDLSLVFYFSEIS